MKPELAALAQQAIGERVFPGCAVGIIRANGEREVLPFGHLRYDESPEVAEDTIYDLASVTKSIPVASLAALFIESGRFSLSQKIRDYLPELQNDYGATIEDLLRYRVRGPRMSAVAFPTFEQVRTYMLETGFDEPPGKGAYANAPAFILGLVLERVAGMKLPELAHNYFFGPLEMSDTTFFPHDIERIAPTEIVDGTELRGIVHDESARLFAQKRRAVAHAGLFSTVPDLLNFIRALFDGRFPAVLDAAQQGLGWQLYPGGVFGKTGFTGTFVAVDPKRKVGVVALSNRTYPHRPADTSKIESFRSGILAIMGSLV